MLIVSEGSRIPIPVHVDKTCPETEVTPDLVKTSVSAVMVLDQLTMSSIAKWSIGTVFTVA